MPKGLARGFWKRWRGLQGAFLQLGGCLSDVPFLFFEKISEWGKPIGLHLVCKL
jgi:hypothetical protein